MTIFQSAKALISSATIICIALISTNASAVPFTGPDAFGHVGSNITFNLRDVSGTGADVGLDNSDDDVAVDSIGFDFSFYGNSFSEVEISTNGFVSFTQSSNDACCDGETIPTAGGEIDNFIAGFWEDLDPSEGGIIRTETRGNAGSRQYVVGFYEVRDNDDPDNSINTFEIILHEGTNDIELQLALLQFDDVDDKVIGIENADGTDGIEFAFISQDDPLFSNGDILFANTGVCFSSGGTNCEASTTSVPEPGTLVLFSIAIVGLGFIARRRRTT